MSSVIDVSKYIYAYDPTIKRRVAHVIHKGYAISLASGNRFKYDEAIVALEQKENKNKIIHKIDEIVSKDIWDFGQRIEEIEDEVDMQITGRKPQMTNEQIDEIDKLKGRVLEARKIKNYLEEVRTKSKEVLELMK